MKRTRNLLALAVFATAGIAAAGAQSITADEILSRLDKGQTFDTMKSLGTMTITDSLGSRKTEFINNARGKDDSFMEFTSAAEKGQKILRNSKELYLFFPESEEITRLQGSALRQNMAGSDISYEDLTGNRNRKDNYTATFAGDETIDGRACFHILLEANKKKHSLSETGNLGRQSKLSSCSHQELCPVRKRIKGNQVFRCCDRFGLSVQQSFGSRG